MISGKIGSTLMFGVVLLLAALASFGSSSGLPALADGGPALEPASVAQTINLGASGPAITKTVHTPPFPPEPDICFLADTTASMGPAIANVKANATAVMGIVQGAQSGARFCAAAYRDIGDAYEYQLTTAMNASIATVQAGINTWAAAGGGDVPEAQLQALAFLASQPATGWGASPPKTRVIAWFGDSNGHDPSGSSGTTLAGAIAALTGPPNVTVIAVPVATGGNGLDTGGQATAIANATSGQVIVAATPDQVAAAILAGLANLPVTVSMTSDCAAPISVSFVPASVGPIVSGGHAAFTETISVAAGGAPGVYECDDWALLNGVPMRDANNNIIKEHKTITVPVQLDATPNTATNELGTPGQTHTVTATVKSGAVFVPGITVRFTVAAGPNSVVTGTSVTNPAGQTTFTYPALQGLAGLGTDTIDVCVVNAGSADGPCDKVSKTWVDTTPPKAACLETNNPSGGNVPNAPGKGGQGQNQDGFYELTAKDLVDPNPKIFVVDTGKDGLVGTAADNTTFGPFPSGTKIKYTEANGAKPTQDPGAGDIDWKIKGQGDAAVFAVDASGNASKPVACLVPPPPK